MVSLAYCLFSNFHFVVLHVRSRFASPDCVDETIALDRVVFQSMPDGNEQFMAMFLIVFPSFFKEAAITCKVGYLGSASHLAGFLSFKAVEVDVGLFDGCRDELPKLVSVLVEDGRFHSLLSIRLLHIHLSLEGLGGGTTDQVFVDVHLGVRLALPFFLFVNLF